MLKWILLGVMVLIGVIALVISKKNTQWYNEYKTIKQNYLSNINNDKAIW